MKLQGRFKYTVADKEMSDYERIVVIMEEVGEVSTCCLEESKACAPGETVHDKRSEVVQVAACCVAWLEHIDSSKS